MKFRGKMTDTMCIRQFTQLIVNVSRMTKVCVMKLMTDKVCLVVSEGSALSSSPGLWAEFEQLHYFTEYTMEGVTEEDNQIFMELQTDILAKIISSLKSCQSVKSLKIKLTRKLSPCLTFELEMISMRARPRLVVHDVPVTLVPRRLWSVHKEPCMSQPFDASIYLPPLRQLRHVVDCLKMLSNTIILSLSRAGHFVVSVEASAVAASTYFNNLQVPSLPDSSDSDGVPRSTKYSASVDAKKLLAFLQGDHPAAVKVICSVLAGRVVHLFLLQDNISLHYYLPAVSS